MHTTRILVRHLPLLAAGPMLIGEYSDKAAAQCGPIWSSQFAGDSNLLNGAVNALATFDDDGDGQHASAIFAAGDFTFAGTATLNHVGRRAGLWWSALGVGLDGPAHALLTVEPDQPGIPRGLYVGGDFSTAGGAPAPFIARWDGAAWHALAGGPNTPVHCLAIYDDDGDGPNSAALYAGTAAGVSRWDGTAWTSFSATGRVQALAVFDRDEDGPELPRLFAGGRFGRIDGVNASCIAGWNGVAWTALGNGLHDYSGLGVSTLTSHRDSALGPYLVAGGAIRVVDEPTVWNIARWDGVEWSGLAPVQIFPLGCSLARSTDVDGEGPLPPELHAFDFARGVLNRWTGSEFVSAVPINNTALLYDLIAVDENGDGLRDLVLGGDFDLLTAPGRREVNYAVWDGAGWLTQREDTGTVLEPVAALLTADLDGPGPLPMMLFKSGGLSDFPLATLTAWDGLRWSDISYPLFNTSVTTMTIFDPDGAGPLGSQLVIGGQEAGDVNGPGVAAWDGLAWTPLPMLSRVNALTSYEVAGTPRLFAGTEFGVRMWDGANWTDVPDLLGSVTTLLTFDRDGDGPSPRVLVAAGDFLFAPSGGRAYAARFNGTSWSQMGSQINGPVDTAVAIPNSSAPGAPQSLYAFAPMVGGAQPDAVYMLRWSPAAVWEPVLSTPVGRTLCAVPYDLGTAMTLLRGTESAIEFFDGVIFNRIGFDSSTGNPVRALATAPAGTFGSSSISIFAGGDFYRVGNVSSRFLAWWRSGETTILQQARGSEFVAEGRTARFAVVADGATPLTFHWRRDGVPLTDNGRIIGVATPTLTIAPVQFGDEGDYDVVVSNDCDAAISDPAELIVTGGNCPADINGDRLVSLQDLAFLLARFGDSMSIFGNADITADGQVDFQDLALLLAAFGSSCP